MSSMHNLAIGAFSLMLGVNSAAAAPAAAPAAAAAAAPPDPVAPPKAEGNQKKDLAATLPDIKVETGRLANQLTEVQNKLNVIMKADAETEKRLMSLGIEPGTGVAIQIPLGAIEGRAQSEAVVTGLAYIALHPFYWRSSISSVARSYCANSWIGATVNQPMSSWQVKADQIAAASVESVIAYAREKVLQNPKLRVDELAESLGKAFPNADRRLGKGAMAMAKAAMDYLELTNKEKEKEAQTGTNTEIEQGKKQEAEQGKKQETEQGKQETGQGVNNQAPNDTESPPAKKLRKQIEKALSSWLWHPGIASTCMGAPWGMYLGVSFPYTAQIANYSGAIDRKMSPGFSFGLAFSPSSYLSLLTGWTYSTFEESSEAPAAKNRHSVVTATVSLGGNLDIFTKLFLK